MSLPASPPQYVGSTALVPPIREGNTGWRGVRAGKAVNAARMINGAAEEWEQLEPDGDFGPVTRRALRGYQRHEGLIADGIAGRRRSARCWPRWAAACTTSCPPCQTG